MPRKLIIRTSLYPYHVTARSNNKEWFELPMKEVWELAMDALKTANEKHPVNIINFVLMNNHYHLMMRTPESNIDSFMYELNKNFALSMQKKTGRINKIFGSRYKWCLITNTKYLSNCYRYVYQNPLRAGIVTRCEDYPFSSLYYKAKGLTFPLPLCDEMGFADEFKLLWLNERIHKNEEVALKSALYRSTLSVLKDREKRKII